MKLVLGVENDEPYTDAAFPGILCHNHLFPVWNTPRRDDWTTFCDPEVDDGDTDKCISLQEAAFGTVNLEKLKKIHLEVDPLRMFDTSDGVGYAEGVEPPEEDPVEPPEEDPVMDSKGWSLNPSLLGVILVATNAFQL